MRTPGQTTHRITIIGEATPDRSSAPGWVRSLAAAAGAVLLAALLVTTGVDPTGPQPPTGPRTASPSVAARPPSSLDPWAVVRRYRTTADGSAALVVATSTARPGDGFSGDHTAPVRRAAHGFGVAVLAWRERSYSFIVAARGVRLADLLQIADGIEMVPTGVASAPLPTPRRIPAQFVPDRVTSGRLSSPLAAGGEPPAG